MKTIFSLLKNIWLPFTLILCPFGLIYWAVTPPDVNDDPGTEQSAEKQQIVLNEFLKPEIQGRLMHVLLSNETVGSLYEEYISLKINGIPPEGMLDKPPKPSELIKLAPYSSLEEFYKINPDCCYSKIVSNQESCIKQIREIRPFRGEHICVYFKYKLRYFDENGVLKERENNEYSAAMIQYSGKIVLWEPYLSVYIG